MDDLQYVDVDELVTRVGNFDVLNLVINGWPSILLF